MEFWSILSALILLMIALPYLRILWKRSRMVCKLKAVCRKKKAALSPAHRLWMLGKRNGFSPHFYIETQKSLYSVKLFTGRPRRTLVFAERREYFFRRLLVFPPFRSLLYTFDGRKRILTACNFRNGFLKEWEKKSKRDILLIHPALYEVLYRTDRGEEQILGCGDSVYGCALMSLAHLIGELEAS